MLYVKESTHISSLHCTNDEEIANIYKRIEGFTIRNMKFEDVELDRQIFQGITSMIYIELIAEGRVWCLGFVYGSSNGEVWRRYINQSRLLIKSIIENGENVWLSIRAGIDN